MKKNFVTGLIILLPFAVTLAIVFFILNLLTGPLMGFLEPLIAKEEWYLKHTKLIYLLAQVILLVALFLFTVLLGFLAKILVFKSLFTINEYIFHKIPIIRTLYKTSQQVIKTIFGSSSKSFKQVVMVSFPKEHSYSIGFISGDAPSQCKAKDDSALLSVFVPTTPNPTSGFLLMCRKEDLIFLDMKVEEAFKLIISCGTIANIPHIPNL